MSRFQVSRVQLPLVLVLVLSVGGLSGKHAVGQSGMRESLERLDTNGNGEIDPDEITPLARPYLERVAEARRMSLDRSYSIERYQEAARVYFAMQNGIRGERVRVESQGSILKFGADEDQPLIPDFGTPILKYPYLQEDLEEAEQTIRRYDRDRDGMIDRPEANRASWTHRDPFDMDLNKDDRLSKIELAQRYARRRLVSRDSGELIQKVRRVGNGIESSERRDDDRESSRWWKEGGNSYWLTASLMSRFDSNRNGRLEGPETLMLGIPLSRIDLDRDGELSRDELFAHLKGLQDEAGDVGGAIPGWFYERDTDQDGQVSMQEFAAEWSEDSLVEFAALDTNQDGLLTTAEVALSAAMTGGTFTNSTAEILPPRKTTISELEIDQDLMIGDLNLQLSLTHTNVSYLDGYLTGPDGQRVELFGGVGGSGNNFEDTLFDDQASNPITKGRPPFEGSYLPAAAIRKEPSLSYFNGKNARGIWQLVIRGTRSERFGMLHSWSLICQPNERLIDATLAKGISTEENSTQAADTASPTSDDPAAPAETLAAPENKD